MLERATILVVDDEEQMRKAMSAVLSRLGHSVLEATQGEEALGILESAKVDLVVSDLKMPVMSGDQFLAKLRERENKTPVILITAYGTIGQAVEAMKNGAFDFITKPFAADDLEKAVVRALRPGKKHSPKSPPPKSATAILTADSAFKRILEIASAVARSSASVLVQGESGTGKELISQLIHLSSDRADGPFVAVNCAALPDNLLESELFGHEKGSFTGAVGTKIGKFEQANGGTILLDEISEMDLQLQAKLLRVLQEREVDRVGGTRPIPVDVRVVATTNRDLKKTVAEGKFREDLYYRLNVIPLFVPPLRERKGDVKLLVEHFVRRFSATAPKRISQRVIAELSSYQWPGNVRELQNSCERAVLLSSGDEVQLEHFLLGTGGTEPASSELTLRSGLTVAEAEKRLIIETLRATGNNKTRAAELLGISIRTLRNKLHEYGVSPGDDGVAERSEI